MRFERYTTKDIRRAKSSYIYDFIGFNAASETERGQGIACKKAGRPIAAPAYLA